MACAVNNQAGDYDIAEKTVTTDVPNQQLLAPDPTRTSIIMSPCEGQPNLYITTQTDPTCECSGLSLPSDGKPLVMNYRDYGPLLGSAWYLNGPSGATGSELTMFTTSYRPGGG